MADDLFARVQARRAEVREAFGLEPGRTLVRGKSAVLYSRHLFSGFMRCGTCGGAVTVVTGGYGSPRYGCLRSWKNGRTFCDNRLTVRSKLADSALLAGLQGMLTHPDTLGYVTQELTQALNAMIDARPQRRAELARQQVEARRKLAHLIAAVEGGATMPSLLESLRAREGEIDRLTADIATLDEPLQDKLAVMPHWVKEQLEDVAGLLRETPERTKGEFKRLGLQFSLHPVRDEGRHPFLRAISETDLSQRLSSSTTGRLNRKTK